eukprot:scaffold13607_cov117-Skeletonema_dohrnii-CCMP3373.AAC.1
MMKRCLFPSLALIINITLVSSSYTETQTHRYLRGSGNFMTRGLEECPMRSSTCNSTQDPPELSYIAPTGNNGIINATDGVIGVDEWDLTKCGIPMYKAGNAAKPDGQLSQAWLDWDCTTNTLCILIETLNETEYFIADDSDADAERWIKIYDNTNKGSKPPKTSGWTNIKDENDDIIAIEACYNITQDVTCINRAEIHANIVPPGNPNANSDTSSTGSKSKSGFIAIKLQQCPLPTSKPSLSPSSSGQPSSWPSANPTNSPETPLPTILATSKPSKAVSTISSGQPSSVPSASPSLS